MGCLACELTFATETKAEIIPNGRTVWFPSIHLSDNAEEGNERAGYTLSSPWAGFSSMSMDMDVYQWLVLFVQQLKDTDLLQWTGVLFGIAEVVLARANKIALYPAGIISVSISGYILFQAGLYAECLLNGYYLLMSFYGWWLWLKRKGGAVIPVSYSGRKDWKVAIGIVVGAFFLLWWALQNFTPSTVPVWDAWVSATAWAGMWLLARRKIENWLFLNISNAFAIPLLIHKQLPLYALLTLFLFVVAIQGFFKWRRIVRNSGENLQTKVISVE